jgi:hypothetical protein
MITRIPSYAADYPEIAETLAQAMLPFYCINCYRKRETRYVTPNFGPFCENCLKELKDPIDVALAALQNYGADVECGSCMEIAFTGDTTNKHTCVHNL